MGIEIERKYLIELPDTAYLANIEGARVLSIVQTYLAERDGAERRVRSVTERGGTKYVYTEKMPLGKISRVENEREISRDEYCMLLTEAVSRLTKTRYAVPFCGHVIEVDVYPDDIGGDVLRGCAVLEVELADEEEKFSLPPYITVIRELCGEREYSNKSLAKPI